MRTHTIVVTPAFPSLPTALRYPQVGVDRLGEVTFGLTTQDVADAFGWFYGVVTGQVVPAGGTAVATLGGANAFVGACSFTDLTVISGNKYKLSSRTVFRVASDLGKPNNATDWTFVALGGYYTQVTTNAGAVLLTFALDLPNGSILTSVAVELQGAGVHAGAPGTLPVITLMSLAVAPAAVVLLGSVTDPYTSAGVYDAAHALVIPSGSINGGSPLTIDRTTKRYLVAVSGEGGANFRAGLGVYAISWTATVTSQDDGAS